MTPPRCGLRSSIHIYTGCHGMRCGVPSTNCQQQRFGLPPPWGGERGEGHFFSLYFQCLISTIRLASAQQPPRKSQPAVPAGSRSEDPMQSGQSRATQQPPRKSQPAVPAGSRSEDPMQSGQSRATSHRGTVLPARGATNRLGASVTRRQLRGRRPQHHPVVQGDGAAGAVEDAGRRVIGHLRYTRLQKVYSPSSNTPAFWIIYSRSNNIPAFK